MVEVDHPRIGPIKLVGPAVQYNGERMKISKAPPYLGQHTREVLLDLGYSEADIESMRKERIIR